MRKQTTEDPELADRFDRVLGETVEAMDESGLRYVFIGGIASGGLGRPRSTHDIDIFVMPEDAELALRALAKKNFRTERTDPTWLYKAFKEDILVDVIFKSKGEIYLDQEMYGRSITAPFHNRQLRLVAPEDLLIIKAVAHSELTPGHWHDATALLSHAKLDWPYLILRARRAPRRVLSLLLYAQSNDIWVPNYVIHELYEVVFGERERIAPPRAAPLAARPSPQNPYTTAHLRSLLAEDPRTHELDIEIEYAENRLLLRGEVPYAERRQAIEKIVQEYVPGCRIENQIRVTFHNEPTEAEALK
ncbi:MAG: nucleotidyltransferase [Oligoflexia bacterium]|nr:nucleotidyltransferase [Oligoflexia bacterium]